MRDEAGNHSGYFIEQDYIVVSMPGTCYGGGFMKELKEILENPVRLLV